MPRQCSSCGGFCKKSGCERENAQPEKEWVGLTDEEMMQSYIALKSVAGFYSLEKYARDIEARLKEKNT